jgi:opacity protein-like surface antigen
MIRRIAVTFAAAASALASVLSVTAGASAVVAHVNHPAHELGVAVKFGEGQIGSDATVMTEFTQVFHHLGVIHANAVSINFPFYMSSQTASSVQSAKFTPSPFLVGQVVRLAHRDGFTVQLRPYLSETNFNTAVTGNWRGSIKPANVPAWFASYRAWLAPYVAVARLTGVESFSIGTEFNSLLTYVGYWMQTANWASHILGGPTIYSASHLGVQNFPNTQLGWDAYPVIHGLTDTSSVAQITNGLESYLRTLGFPNGLTSIRMEEVGIPALSGAYTFPSFFYQKPPYNVIRSIQANWFQAMCNSFWALHMKGIYFWAIDASQYSPSRNYATDPFDWIGTASESQIASCFTRAS